MPLATTNRSFSDPENSVQEDIELFNRCRNRDGKAWEALVMKYRRLIYTIPRRAGLSEAQADDVFQSVFEALFTQIDRIEHPTRLHAWLVTIAKRDTMRTRASGARHHSIDESDEVNDYVSEIADERMLPDEALESLSEFHRVRWALDKLGPPCQGLLEALYDDEPMSYSELSQHVGIPVGSIGPTKARCLAKLRHILEPVS
jgi:RNA polymerase sigma factor (sigma-70 family)